MPVPVRVTPKPPEPPKPWVPFEPNIRASLSWTGPNGDTLPLSGHLECEVESGATGLDMPPYSIVMDDGPEIDGSTVRSVRVLPREIFLPLRIEAPDRDALRAATHRLVRAFDPTFGIGRLTVAQPDGSARYIDAYYAGGAEGNMARGAFYPWAQRYAVTLRCPDPYFYGMSPQVATFKVAGSGNLLGDPFFPLRLTASEVIGVIDLANDGDVSAYPVFDITGPGGVITASALGKAWSITGSIGGGEVYTVDTRPGRKAITDANGVNLWPRLATDPPPVLWSVPPGVTTATISVGSATDATRVTISLVPRFKAA